MYAHILQLASVGTLVYAEIANICTHIFTHTYKYTYT